MGIPGEIKETIMQTRKGSHKIETKIGNDGCAVMERHHTNHGYPTKHSNPHDHSIDWSKESPHFNSPIIYEDNFIPEFKHFERKRAMEIQVNSDDLKFESISDFKFSLINGGEIEFEWSGKSYGVFRESENDDAFFLCEAYKEDNGTFFKTVDELLDYTIDGRSLRELITEVTVTWRNV